MIDLKPYFITTDRPFTEGAVEVFTQRIEGCGKATLTITALGLYEAEINGVKVGKDLFTPGFTYYPKRLNVQTYDVTDLLTGQDTLTVYLAQGWYCGRFTFDNKCQIYGEHPAAAWVLTIGDRVYTSRDAITALPSPYAYAGFYDGEVYDEQQPQTVFPPVPYTGELPERLEETILTVRMQEEMPVQSVTVRGDTTIIDFGQNFAGFVCIDPEKMDAAALKLRHGEILNADGTLYTTNLRKAKAQTIYHKGSKVYRPRFTYMGFRYVELTGCTYVPGMLKAYAIYSDMPRTGDFHCDNPLVDQLYRNQVWGQKSNYVEVPTDCPQRDERMGYTGDGQVFAQTGAFNFDTERFWEKYLADIRDSQSDNTEGYVAPTVPAQGKAGIGFMSMLGWGNCDTIVPEMLLKHFGTDRYLREQYDSMKAFVACELRKMGDKHLWLGPSLGDWLMLGKDTAWMAMHNGPVSNAFIANDLRIMAETAARFGLAEDAAFYASELEKVRAAYTVAFINDDGTMKDDYQGAYILALKYVIPRGELWDRLYENLVAHIRSHGMQTGFFATEHILPMLAENGHAGLAIHLLLQEHCPGWMYQVKRGATTTWERWDSLRPDGTVNEDNMSDDNMVSFNHYSFGSVGRFLYQYILGIQAAEPGFAKVRFAPLACHELGAARGSYLSRAGRIVSAWKVADDTVTYSIETPVPAQVILADGTVHEVASGSYTFACSAAALPTVEALDYDAIAAQKETAEPAAAPAPAAGKLNLASTIGEILADPRGKAIVDALLPGFSANEQAKAAYGTTFPAIAAMMHLPEALMATLAEKLERLSAPAKAGLNANSTIGEILADPRGKTIVDKLIPGLSANEQLKAAYGITFPRIAGMMHLPEQLLQQLAKQLDQLAQD